MTDPDMRVENNTLILSPGLRTALIEAARTEHQAKLTEADNTVITEGVTRQQVEADFDIELPDDFTPMALFPGIDTYPDTEKYAGQTGTCTVAYGHDAGGSYLFDLTCEAQGMFTGSVIDNCPAFVDVQAWHNDL